SAGSFGDSEGVARAGTGVEVGHELCFRDQGRAVRETGVELRDLNVLAVLEGQFDGALQGEGNGRGVGWNRLCFLRPRRQGGERQQRYANDAEGKAEFRAGEGSYFHARILFVLWPQKRRPCGIQDKQDRRTPNYS